ncbi:MAG: ROK family protein [Planctomycetota bacterium]|nr:ROK family protein [Planctomycetota bacterium]MDA1212208.1 ROK family protein [Planctomycetota bacterium]
MAERLLFLGIDVGGTNVKAGVVDYQGKTLSHTSIPTQADQGPETGVKNICRAAELALQKSDVTLADIQMIGLATPGTMDLKAGMLLDPPNLPGWNDFPIRQRVREHFDKPTILQNDANAAAYGEYWIGAGRDANSLVFWTLGTGIGCGIIINHMIIEGEHSHGAECGHIVIQMDDGRPCDTGQTGTLEAYAGGKSLVRRVEEQLVAGRRSSLSRLIEDGTSLSPLLIGQACEEGDELAEEMVMDVARCLGVGTTTLMHTIDPDMVLFGGAMTFGRDTTKLGRRFLQRIKDEVKRRAFPIPYAHTKIDYATLGGDAGYIGAAGCAKLKYDSMKQTPDLP